MENTEKKEQIARATVTNVLDMINEICEQNGWKLFEYSFEHDEKYGQHFLTVKMY